MLHRHAFTRAAWTLLVATLILGINTAASAADEPATQPTAPAPEKKPAPAPAPETAPKPESPAASDKPAEAAIEHVLLTTNKGEIVLELNREKAPISVANFLNYVDKEAYNGTVFHRVMSNFMIQGGGFTRDMQKKPTDQPIKNEWQNGLKNVRGSVAMARLGRQADSATNQFFINVVDNPFLDEPNDGSGYAVFGKVIAGMGAVDAIRAEPVQNIGGMGNVPVEPVVIEKASHLTADQAAEKVKAEAAKAKAQ